MKKPPLKRIASRRSVGGAEKGSKVARNRWIRIHRANPLHGTRLRFSSFRLVAECRKKGRKPSSASSNASSRVISVRSVPPISEDPAPSTVISTDFRFGSLSSFSLAAPHCLPQGGPLADRKLLTEFGFHEPGEGEIEIVAAQQQMLADGGTGEFHPVAIAIDADQREVAGASADVANQNILAVEHSDFCERVRSLAIHE